MPASSSPPDRVKWPCSGGGKAGAAPPDIAAAARPARARIREGAPVKAGAPPFELLERLLDGALELDPETRHVSCPAVGQGRRSRRHRRRDAIRLHIDDETHPRRGPRDDALDADVTIRGAPLSLVRFVLAGDRETLILGEEVSLHGDIALATQPAADSSARMDIDFEEAIARAHRRHSRRTRSCAACVGWVGWMRAAGSRAARGRVGVPALRSGGDAARTERRRAVRARRRRRSATTWNVSRRGSRDSNGDRRRGRDRRSARS